MAASATAPAAVHEPLQTGYHSRAMTVIYGDATYHLSDDAVTVVSAGREPASVEPDSLPLPVSRVLRAFS